MNITMRIVLEKDNEPIYEYTLKNDNNMEVKILTLGGIITDILVPDKYGNVENVVLKLKNIKDYLNDSSYKGSIVGRTAGRIADAKAVINGIEYDFNINNNGVNSHHGGIEGFNKKLWEHTTEYFKDKVALKLELFSLDNDEKYPGNLKVRVMYTLNNQNELEIIYCGESDKDTLLNMTNHSYFNLSGNAKRSITDEVLQIKSDSIAAIREDGALSGEILDVSNTPFDFRKPKLIGKDIDVDNEQLKRAGGYDHPWVLSAHENCIKLVDNESGRVLEVSTDHDAAMIYTDNFPGDKELSIGRYEKERDAICFETQNLPIGENNKFIERVILKKNTVYRHETKFKFSVVK